MRLHMELNFLNDNMNKNLILLDLAAVTIVVMSLNLGILANSSSKKFTLTGRAPPCLCATEIKHS